MTRKFRRAQVRLKTVAGHRQLRSRVGCRNFIHPVAGLPINRERHRGWIQGQARRYFIA